MSTASVSGPGTTPASSSSTTPATPATPTQSNTTPNIQSGSNTQSTPESNTTTPQVPYRFKREIKVNGQIIPKDLDEDQLEVYVSKAIGLEKQASELANTKHMLKKDTAKALEQAGIDPVAFAEALLQKQIEESMLSPEERQSKAQTSELEQLKAELAELKGAESKKARAELEQKLAVQAQQELTKSLLTSLSSLPEAEMFAPDDKEFLTLEAAAIGVEAYKLGIDLPPEAVAKEAMARLNTHKDHLSKKILTTLSGESLLKFLGDDVVKKIASAYLSKYQAGLYKPQTNTNNLPKPETDEQAPRKMINASEILYGNLKF